MMHTNQENLAELAWQTRGDFEAGRIARPLLARLYSGYNPDIADTNTYLDQAAEMFPAGNCGLTAVYLRHVLQDGEIIPAWPKNPGVALGLTGQKITHFYSYRSAASSSTSRPTSSTARLSMRAPCSRLGK